MFHLWRKRRSLALFPHQLLLDDGSEPIVVQPDYSSENALLTAFVETLLDAKSTSRRKIRLLLALSDSFAAIIALPWQSALSQASEIDAYAHMQFELAGQALDERWIMFSYYRHFGAAGLAYALPTELVQRLHEIALAHDAVIDSILPLSALAYARHPRSRQGTKALILRESSRVTALVIGTRGLMAYATEPAVSENDRSVERLLRRLQVEHELQLIEGCSTEPELEANLSSFVSCVLPSMRFTVADHRFWKR